jgi:hypothetical protein
MPAMTRLPVVVAAAVVVVLLSVGVGANASGSTAATTVFHAAATASTAVVQVSLDSTVLVGLASSAVLTLAPAVQYSTWPNAVDVVVTGTLGGHSGGPVVVIAPSARYDVFPVNGSGSSGFAVPTIALKGLRFNQSGAWDINVTVSCVAPAEPFSSVASYFSSPSPSLTDKSRNSSALPAFCTDGSAQMSASASTFVIPGVLSLLPPLLTLLCAVVTKMTFVSLLLGIWVGAFFLNSYNPVSAFLRTFDQFFLDSFCNSGHSGIILFTLLLGGLLGR